MSKAQRLMHRPGLGQMRRPVPRSNNRRALDVVEKRLPCLRVSCLLTAKCSRGSCLRLLSCASFVLCQDESFPDVSLYGGSPIVSSFATSVCSFIVFKQAMCGSDVVPTGLVGVCLVLHRLHVHFSSDPTLCVGSPVVFTLASVVSCCTVFKLILGRGMSTSTRSDSFGVPGWDEQGRESLNWRWSITRGKIEVTSSL